MAQAKKSTEKKQVVQDGVVVQGDGTTPVGDQVKQENDSLLKGAEDRAHDVVEDPQVQPEVEANNTTKAQVRAERTTDVDASEAGEASGNQENLVNQVQENEEGPAPTSDGGAAPTKDNEPETPEEQETPEVDDSRTIESEQERVDQSRQEQLAKETPEFANREKFEELAKDLEDNRWQGERQSNEDYIYLEVAQSKIDEIIGNLRRGDYDDFASTRFATPKLQMIADFEVINRKDVADAVRNGEYDQ